MKLKLALGLLLSLWSSPALAGIPAPSNYWAILRSPQGEVGLIDAGTAIRKGNQAGYWLQVDQANGITTRAYTVADCNNRTLVPMWLVVARNGMIINNQAIANPAVFNVQTGSLAEQAYQSVCFNHLDALVRARQSNAEMINRAIQGGLMLGR